jgi:hypothetical protein
MLPMGCGGLLKGAQAVVALVVLLRGVNVGGHKTFRPAVLAAHLNTSMPSTSARPAPS